MQFVLEAIVFKCFFLKHSQGILGINTKEITFYYHKIYTIHELSKDFEEALLDMKA
jgi:hypothetical protein